MMSDGDVNLNAATQTETDDENHSDGVSTNGLEVVAVKTWFDRYKKKKRCEVATQVSEEHALQGSYIHVFISWLSTLSNLLRIVFLSDTRPHTEKW